MMGTFFFSKFSTKMSFTFITRKYSYLKFGREPGINSTCLLRRRVLTLPLALSSAGPEVLWLRRGLRRPLELEQVAPRMSFGGNVRQQWEKRGKLRVPTGPTGGRVPKYKEGRGWSGIRLFVELREPHPLGVRYHWPAQGAQYYVTRHPALVWGPNLELLRHSNPWVLLHFPQVLSQGLGSIFKP